MKTFRRFLGIAFSYWAIPAFLILSLVFLGLKVFEEHEQRHSIRHLEEAGASLIERAGFQTFFQVRLRELTTRLGQCSSLQEIQQHCRRFLKEFPDDAVVLAEFRRDGPPGLVSEEKFRDRFPGGRR